MIKTKFSPARLGLCWSVIMAIMLLFAYKACDGHLVYSLDDPYIHLAVGETIKDGGYGVNLGEYSAPCSSIAYPFMLAATELAGLGAAGPLVINLLAMLAAVYIVGLVIRDYVCMTEAEESGAGGNGLWPFALGMTLCLVMNSWGLVMTGMEHSLHILASLAAVYAAARLACGKTQSTSLLVLAAASLPLFRFEGMAMAFAAFAFLLALRYFKPALLLAVLLLAEGAAWTSYMKSMGLPAMPSSVQLKSGIVSGAVGNSGLVKLAAAVGKNLFDSFKSRQGTILICLTILLVALLVDAWRKGARRTACFALLAATTTVAHIVLGKYGWFNRYEIYAVTTAGLAVLILVVPRKISSVYKVALLLAMVLLAAPYLLSSFRTPAACRNIYEQQFQMHRFVVDYWKAPAAVNDLGLVSYHNPYYVLDLYGLGSEEVRKLRLQGGLARDKLASLVDTKSVRLVMVYDDWFNSAGLPESWRKIGMLKTSKVTAAYDSVTFYLVGNGSLEAAKASARDFSTSLPAGSTFELAP